MNQQTVYQTVSVQDELPKRIGEYYVRVEDYKAVGILSGNIFYADDKNLHATHWLKPTTGYFFTPDEFRRLAEDLYQAGYERCAGEENVCKIDNAVYPDFQTFYNQLTESK